MAWRYRLLRSSDYVLVQLDESAAQIGSIVVPEVAQSVALEGVVLATGGEVRGVAVGDRVGVPWAVGVDLSMSGVACRQVREGDLLYAHEGL